MEKVKEIAAGKAKSMFTTNNPNELIMEFRDDASAFDGKKRASLAGKGAVNNQFNAFVMEFLASKGIETHFIKLLSNHESLVYKLEMFPIECVIINRASGSICKRLGTEDGLILDIGKKSIAIIDKEIAKTKEVLWCGPLGLFEQSPFHVGTASVAKTLSKMTKNGKIISVAGGGDTVAAISQSNYVNDFTYISTAGGAFLEMIAGQKLPGIEVLRK